MAYSFNLAVLCIRDKRMKRLRRKRRRRDVCKHQKPSLEIPFELQIDILMRVPVKSLMRFKSVSKLWSSLICSQYFTDRFLKVSSSPLRVYMWMWCSFRNGLFNKVLLSASSSSDSDLSSFVVDQTHLTFPSMEAYSVSHVYQGLMCFVYGPNARIYNTSTRQLVLLPHIEESELIDEERKRFRYNIGHDPVHNQYKVVCIVSGPRINDMTEIWVLLLEGDGSSQWRKISSPFQQHYSLSQGVTINGRVHYVACVSLLPLLIVSFDIRSEEISILEKPEDQAFWPHDIIEYNGRVAILDHINLEDEGVMNLWVLEDEEKKSWLRKTLVLHASQRYMIKDMGLKVHGTNRNGEIIFVPRRQTLIVRSQIKTHFYVFFYNIQNNHLRKVQIKETSNRQYVTKIWDAIGFDDVENLMYF